MKYFDLWGNSYKLIYSVVCVFFCFYWLFQTNFSYYNNLKLTKNSREKDNDIIFYQSISTVKFEVENFQKFVKLGFNALMSNFVE